MSDVIRISHVFFVGADSAGAILCSLGQVNAVDLIAICHESVAICHSYSRVGVTSSSCANVFAD